MIPIVLPALAATLTTLVILSNSQAVAADLPVNATRNDILEFEYRMQVASVPTGSPRFEVSPELLMSATQTCVSQYASMFDPQFRTSELATQTALERLKKKLVYIEVREPNDESYFLGNSDDIKFHLCTAMILTGVTDLAAPTRKIPMSFLSDALAMPEADEIAILSIYGGFTEAADLTPAMIDHFFDAIFKRNLSWRAMDDIIADTFASRSSLKGLLVKTLLSHIYESAIFQEYKVYFSHKILKILSTAQFNEKMRAEIVLSGVNRLDNTVLTQTVFDSFSSWQFSQEETMDVYKRFGTLLSPAERTDAIQTIAYSFESISPEIKQEILSLIASSALSGEQKKSLFLSVLAEPKKYPKYGLKFILGLLTNELGKSTWDEEIFSHIVSLTQDAEIPLEHKRFILNKLSLDTIMTQKKVGDLLAYLEIYMLTNSVPADNVKTAIDKIIELAAKDQRTKSFLKRVVMETLYTALTDTITWELIKNYDLTEDDITSLVILYFENSGTSGSQIIDALVRKNELTPYVGRVVAASLNKLAKLESYRPLLVYVMNHSSTDENTRGQIRYKLTGEIPTINDFPVIDWDVKPESKKP